MEMSHNYVTESILENIDNIFYSKFMEGIENVLGHEGKLVLSPGTFDMRFTNAVGIPSMNYGPCILEESHKNNEKVRIEDILHSIEISTMALYSIANDSGEKIY